MGIGSASYHYIIGVARERGNTCIRLKVFYKNEKAIHFYKNMGFQLLEEETTDIGGGYAIIDYVMVKTIS